MQHRTNAEVGRVSYEIGIDEAMHHNPEAPLPFKEHSISKCKYGCKYYRTQNKFVLVLGHHAAYGCKRTKADIRKDAVSA